MRHIRLSVLALIAMILSIVAGAGPAYSVSPGLASVVSGHTPGSTSTASQYVYYAAVNSSSSVVESSAASVRATSVPEYVASATGDLSRPSVGSVTADAGGGGKALWGFWSDYDKVTVGGREYADINGRLYTQHAVERMAPSGYGNAAGGVAGRSISPNYVEDVLDDANVKLAREFIQLSS